MITATKPINEKDRLASLRRLNILDTISEDQYDNVTELAAYICDTKYALISLIDENRQWFKSTIGVQLCETSRDVSFCAHAINQPHEILEIPDTRKDDRFVDNPLVTDEETPVIFYAGVPLFNQDGHVLGTLCVLDSKPKKLSDHQLKALKNLAKQVEQLFRLHAANQNLEVSKKHLSKHNSLLKDFAATVSHDMKMPLANLIVTSDILNQKYSDLIDDDGKQYLSYLKKSSLSLSDYITNILSHYESSSHDIEDRSTFNLNDVLEDIVELINIKHQCEINLPDVNHTLYCNQVALEQIFLNLIGNSIKYNDKEETVISIEADVLTDYYEFRIIDNGIGIPADKISNIFELFNTVGEYDRDGNQGHGIGLSTVKQLVESLDGTIDVDSQLGVSTTFTFTLAR
ncbi:GAF sensor signal transduction histidine kinase [Nonlabens sp. Hel1_33_55]|uniref:sensor histidine kinase n=1 Tax=Nonlabens sp. Hel1_33_55 TaxID=1336802 RepID=UPI000875CCE1|nr:GAF domain-containing sensor histidine kinase [Nonlabens sp. Hel1_33_55]SCY43380.1 GAF sensor signal transduction histidine kinase [Nonlabens sp. Hel1_33_55]